MYDPNRHCGGFTDTEEVAKQVSNDQEDQEEQAQVKNDGTRGGDDAVLLPPIEIQNMIQFFGCKPGGAVEARTEMINDVKQALDTRFDKRNLCCNIP